MMKLPTLSLIAAIALGLSLWATMAKEACATGTIAEQTCDTEVWRNMEARARLETEREIMQNQNLIFKPDSILNYVCFDKLAGHAAANVGSLFTHTSYFGSQVIIPWGAPNGMDEAINKVVIASLTPYLTTNFGHAYLGGKGNEYISGLGGVGGSATAPPPVPANQSSNYSCGEMAKVWALAKCGNFLHTTNLAASDGFFPFVNLAAGAGGGSAVAGYEGVNEVRRYPPGPQFQCSSTPVTGSNWVDMYRLSRNENSFGDPNNKYQFGLPLQQNFLDVRSKLTPGGDNNDCGTPISTGITVVLGPGASAPTFPDGVCTRPGCTFLSGTCLNSGVTTPTPGPI